MKANFFKKIFAIPNYLSLPVAGIEICNNSVKYIEFLNKQGLFSIKHYGEIPLSPNTIKDGDILNKSALVKALIEVKNNISADFVKVSIPEEKTYIFDVQIPKEVENNVKEALEFKIEENVPLKLAEASFEFEIVDNTKSSKDMTVNVSVIPKRVISEYTNVLDQAGIYPVSFEIESKMIANSVISKKDKRASIIINIKNDSTVLAGVVDGYVRVSSSISIGESTIRENLLKAGISLEDLESGKFFENDFSFETAYSKEAYSSLVNIFSIFKDEVEKFNEYIINKYPNIRTSSSKNVDSIILCGRSATLPGLVKHINQKINAEVTLANAWSNGFDVPSCVSDMKFNDSLGFVAPIGLVISSYK